jgi:predicted flap endonuclease-1-like 5' DNA nuclease
VTIERGGEKLQAVVADIDAADLVERVDEQESEDDSDPDPESHEESSEDAEDAGSLTPETVKDEFDVHGPPAHAVASAFDTRQALVDAVQGDDDLTTVDGVGETTAQALRDHLLESDSDGDSTPSGTSKPQQPGDEFEWVGEGKALKPV